MKTIILLSICFILFACEKEQEVDKNTYLIIKNNHTNITYKTVSIFSKNKNIVFHNLFPFKDTSIIFNTNADSIIISIICYKKIMFDDCKFKIIKYSNNYINLP